MTYKSTIASTIRLQGENSKNDYLLSDGQIASTIRLQGENSLHIVDMFYLRLQAQFVCKVKTVSVGSCCQSILLQAQFVCKVKTVWRSSAVPARRLQAQFVCKMKTVGSCSPVRRCGLQAQFVCKVKTVCYVAVAHREDCKHNSFARWKISARFQTRFIP